jgi:hypothetical protein
VAIEVIPPANMALNNIQAVEDLLKRFTNAHHPCWQNRRVILVTPEPSPALASSLQSPPQPNTNSPAPTTPPIALSEDQARRQQERQQEQEERFLRCIEREEQESLSFFARSSGTPTQTMETQWASPPQGMPVLSDDALAEILADVLTEDIELNGDALLEEILNDDEEPPEPPRAPNIPPDVSLEPNLPPEPSQEGRPEDPSEEGRRLQNDIDALNREHAELLNDEVWRTRNDPPCPLGTLPRCMCPREFGPPYPLHDAIKARIDQFWERLGNWNTRSQQIQQRIDQFNQKAENWERWLQQYNRQVEEYNAAFEREHQRIVQERNHWEEEVRQEMERFQRESLEHQERLMRFRREQQQRQQQRLQEAEHVLKSRAARLLDNAQHQVCQASLFPLPMVPRPQRPNSGSRPRSDSPTPLNDAWIRQAEAKLRVGNHNNVIRTSVRRMLRDGCGLSQRTAQNLGDGTEYAVDAAMAFFLGGFSKVGRAANFAENVINAAARRAMGRVEVRLREPRHIPEGARAYERGRDFGRMRNRLRDLDQEGRTIHTPHPERNPQNTRNFKRNRIERAQRYLRNNPEKLRRYLDRVDHSDVDHVHPLGLGGQDTRGNMVFRESGANRSVGAQTGAQTRGRPAGTRVHFD